MPIRLKLSIVVGLIVVVGTALALLIIVREPLQITWHRYQMKQAWNEHCRSGNISDYRRWRSHLEALVELGQVTKIEYRFHDLQQPTEESKRLFEDFHARNCPPYLNYYYAQLGTGPEPIVLTLWYEPAFHDQWITFLKQADKATATVETRP